VVGFAEAALGTAVAAFVWESRRRRRHPVPAGHRPEIVLPHDAEFELWHNALSLCSMNTRVCLAELAIAYRSHHVDLIASTPIRRSSRAPGASAR
jgi:hypothetical protein